MGAIETDMDRQTYELKLKCPICGREGLADMSSTKVYETDDCAPRVHAVTEGFATRNKTDIICSQCQVSAV